MTGELDVAGLAEVLVGHEGIFWRRSVGGWTCRCGEPLTPRGEPAQPEDAQTPWRTHVACIVLGEIRPTLDRLAAAESAVERVRALADEWDAAAYQTVTGDPGWNQGYDMRREEDATDLRAALDQDDGSAL